MTSVINTNFDIGILSISLRQCAIICLPKKGKQCEIIQNWRPLSRLSVTHQLSSVATANGSKIRVNKVKDIMISYLQDILGKVQNLYKIL